MVVVIGGMHRSGTSVTAKLLRSRGLYLGPEEDLLPAVDYNSDGLWENRRFVELNERLLALYGGAWDSPPDFSRSADDGQIESWRTAAQEAIESFTTNPFWGWKDPRNSLALKFWLELLPDLRVVLCLRNPLEVALSLYRRGYPSVNDSLCLWQTYNQRLLDATSLDQRVVVHYDALCRRPERELNRLMEGLAPSAAAAAEQIPSQADVFDELRHSCFRASDLVNLGHTELSTMYLRLCEEAGWTDGVATPSGSAAEWRSKAELDLLRQATDAQNFQKQLAAANRTITGLRQQLDEAESSRQALSECARETLKCELRAVVREETAVQIDEFRTTIARLEQKLADSVLVREQAPATGKSVVLQPDRSYRQLVRRIARQVRRVAPRDATVLVVSKGDEHLLDLPGRQGWHFPQVAGGAYAGSYPASDLAAIAHLEALRLKGADYLLLPSTAFWWLEHYRGLSEHLENTCRDIVIHDNCRLFDLRAPRRSTTKKVSDCQEWIREAERRLGHPPTILDWGSGLGLTQRLSSCTVFSPPTTDSRLPYLDQSIDVVVAPQLESLATEARRVARAAVIAVDSSAHCRVEWLIEPSSAPELSISLIVSPPEDPQEKMRYLKLLRARLPRSFRDKVLELPVGEPYAQACNETARRAQGDILMFFSRPVLPFSESVTAAVELLTESNGLGVVAPKLVAWNGTLEQAGGIVFSDGTLDAFGNGDYQVEDPLYGFVRDVDFSGDVLITRRSIFSEFQGFDSTYRSPALAHADFCLRARERGLKTVYQPECVLAALTAMDGTDLAAEERQRFHSQWRHLLSNCAAAPHFRDRDAWQQLLVHTGNLAEAL